MYKPPSIRDVGLKTHLDGTRSNHNGYNYDDFVKMLGQKVNKANLARLFGVDRDTISKWVVIYEEEEDAKPDRAVHIPRLENPDDKPYGLKPVTEKDRNNG